MAELAGRLATASTLPIMLDSTEPEVLRAGLERLGGRSIVNSVNYEDGDGPGSRFQRTMALVREHGAAVVALCIDEEGQARTADWKVRVADRLIRDLTTNHGMHVEDIVVDTLTFPITTGQEEVRRDALETIEAIRELKRRHSGRADHAGHLERVVRAQRRRPAGAQLGVPARVRERRAGHRDRVGGEDPADGQDRRRAALGRAGPRLRPPPPATGYDPLNRFMELFEGVTAAAAKAGPGRGAGRAAAVRAPRAPDRRRRAQRARGRPRRRARAAARPGDHQRHAAVGDEDRRRAVRVGADAAAVRAAVAPR